MDGLTETEKVRLRFWTEFRRFASARGLTGLRVPTSRHYYEFAVGRTGFRISTTLRVRRDPSGWPPIGVRCELYISHRKSKAAFKKLENEKGKIRRSLRAAGSELEWDPLSKKHACRIVQYRAGSIDQANWPVLFAWLLNRVRAFRRVFRARVQGLDLG